MNLYIKRAEFEALPFREDLKNEPVDNALFRSRAYPTLVFKAYIGRNERLYRWECFGVEHD